MTRYHLSVACSVLASSVALASSTPSTPIPHDYIDPPDFAQSRAGLFGGGSNFCGPASAADGLQWLANNGWPALSPLSVTEDSADSEPFWLSAPLSELIAWNDITSFIWEVGHAMETDVNNETNSDHMVSGLEEIVSVYGDAFYVRHEGRAAGTLASWERGGSFDFALDLMNRGEVVFANVGFYHDADGERCGGHWMCLTGYSTNLITGARSVRLKDPARDPRSFSSHVVTTGAALLEEEDNFDVDGDGINGGIISLTVDSWNWTRSIGTNNTTSDCPLGNNRDGYQDNLVSIGERLIYGIEFDNYTIPSWRLGKDLYGPLHGIKIWDFDPVWEWDYFNYVDRITDQPMQYDLMTGAIQPLPLNVEIADIRRITSAPGGTLLLTSLLDGDGRLLSMVSSQGDIMGQFTTSNPVEALYFNGGNGIEGGFLFITDAQLMMARPGEGLSILAQLPGMDNGLHNLAIDEMNQVLYIARAGGMNIAEFDMKTLKLTGSLDLQSPCEDIAVGGPGWLYASAPQGQPTSVFHAGQLQRVMNLPFSRGLAVSQVAHRSLSTDPEQPDWPWNPGDIDRDGTTGIEDLLHVIAQWGSQGEIQNNADLDGDGLVGIEDMLLVLSDWS
ncbi:MAG: hypothetical protein VX527_11330 [Planctomycetota bacterium]|nr:hypothetical protein [Planctomycetota bacterium]